MLIRKRLRLRVQPRRPRGRPKADDLQALEARLISVARQAFMQGGYEATSINAIARSARVSKNTLYARFADKGAIFRAIVTSEIASVDREMVPAHHNAEEPLAQKISSYINVALRRSLSKEVLEINRLIFSESRQFPELAEIARTRFDVGVQHIAAYIEEAARRDRIPCKDPVGAAAMLLSATNGWYISVLIGDRTVGETDAKEMVATAMKIFMAGRAAW